MAICCLEEIIKLINLDYDHLIAYIPYYLTLFSELLILKQTQQRKHYKLADSWYILMQENKYQD